MTGLAIYYVCKFKFDVHLQFLKDHLLNNDNEMQITTLPTTKKNDDMNSNDEVFSDNDALAIIKVLRVKKERKPIVIKVLPEETITNTSTLQPKTCPSGWQFLSPEKCVAAFLDKVSFDEANSVCQKYGGSLVSIHSDEENDIIATKMWDRKELNEKHRMWIGVRCDNRGKR